MSRDDILTPVVRDRAVGRYAPSPTGDLHPGNLCTALLAREDCARHDGLFILRVEDIDIPRTVAGSEARMLDDLRWLGMDWHEGPDCGGPASPYRQSERSAVYEAALAVLEARGLTYPCTCSRKELQGNASAPHGPEGPAYRGTCRHADPELQRRHPAGAAVRFRVDADPLVRIVDELAGTHEFDLRTLCGDFVIRRRDGLWAYQFACAVDDALMGVTRVVRGADLLSSAARQVALMRALGWPPPVYRHVPLVLDAAGQRMSKRDGSLSLRALRDSGMTRGDVLVMLRSLPVEGGATEM